MLSHGIPSMCGATRGRETRNSSLKRNRLRLCTELLGEKEIVGPPLLLDSFHFLFNRSGRWRAGSLGHRLEA